MIGTETLRALVSAGMSAEQILSISEAMDRDHLSTRPVVDEQAERRRAADRERKKKIRGNSADIPQTPNDIYSNPDILSPEDDKSSSTPRTKRTRIGSGVLLPADWVPILTPAAQKIVDGWPPGWLDGQVAAFRDHATDKGRKSRDWQAAFRTWLGKADEWGRQKNGNRNDSNETGRKIDGFTAACREIIDRFPDEPGRAAHF